MVSRQYQYRRLVLGELHSKGSLSKLDPLVAIRSDRCPRNRRIGLLQHYRGAALIYINTLSMDIYTVWASTQETIYLSSNSNLTFELWSYLSLLFHSPV